MKSPLIVLFFVLPFTIHADEKLKCENEGCYEVIKTFVKLLDEKINEIDKVSFGSQK
jgi:hypothetical protein